MRLIAASRALTLAGSLVLAATAAAQPPLPAPAAPMIPGLPRLDEPRARAMREAAGRPGLEAWQRDLMESLADPDRPRPRRTATRVQVPSGVPLPDPWQLHSSLPRTLADAIHDPLRDRLLVFGGYDGAINGGVWALSLGSDPRWTPIVPSGTPPSPRYLHSAIYDAANDRMVVFGGYDATQSLGDVWALSLGGSPAWTELSPTGGPSPRLGAVAVYDADAQRMVLFGGTNLSTYLNDVWELSLDITPAWTQLAPSSSPPGRAFSAAIRDTLRNELVVFGGFNGGGARNDLWKLTLGASPAWTEVSLPSIPSGRYVSATVYDGRRDRMLLFGGLSSSGQALGDLWALDLAAPAWTPLASTDSVPGPRYGALAILDSARDEVVLASGSGLGSQVLHDVRVLDPVALRWSNRTPGTPEPTERAAGVAVYDPVRERMIVFGGLAIDRALKTDRVTNEVWALSLDDDPAWSQLHPSGTPPPARYFASGVYDALRDRVVIFGGQASTLRNDTWALSLDSSPAWSQILAAGPLPPPRSEHTAIYDAPRDRMVVFGGTSPVTNDVWALTFADDTWAPLSPTGTPPTPRYGHGAVYDPLRDRMLAFGGGAGTAVNEVWSLTLAGTPAWSLLATSGTPPSGRIYSSVAYDPSADRLVVFGGGDSQGLHNDTWSLLLSGTPTWSELLPPVVPGARYVAQTVHDAGRGRLVVHGGYSVSPLGDLWSLPLGDARPAMTVGDTTVAEGDPGSFLVRLSRPHSVPVQVDYGVTGQTAGASDFSAASGSLTIPIGADQASIPFTTAQDDTFEANETFRINLANERHAVLADGLGIATITDDDTAPTASIEDASVDEGDTGTTPVEFTVRLSSGAGVDVEVDYLAAIGTATFDDQDLGPASGTLVIPAGSDTGVIRVDATGDTRHELDETFTVDLSNPVNATLDDGTATGTLRNDDPVPSIAIDDVSGDEGNSGPTAFDFVVRLSAVSGLETRVSFATADGSATTGNLDYVARTDVLSIPAGSTQGAIRIDVNGDTAVEPDETFRVDLTSPVHATMTDSSAIGTVRNDDVATTTNLCGNGDFESGLAGWTNHSGRPLARSPLGRNGGFAMRCSSSSSSTFGAEDQPDWIQQVASAGARYEFKAWVRSLNNTSKAKMRVVELSPSGSQVGSAVTSNEVSLSTTWKLLTLVFTAQRATSRLSLRITESPSSSRKSFLVDDVSIELLPPPVTYTIVSTAGAGGTISPLGSRTVNQGASQGYTITPGSGQRIRDVVVDGGSVGTPASYTFTNVQANHTIDAQFEPIPPGQNLAGNPGFESGLAGWGTYGSGVTLTQVTDAHSGSFAMKVKSSSSSSFGCDDVPDWVTRVAGAGARYQVSAWVKSTDNTGKVKIRMYEIDASGDQVGSTRYSQEVPLTSSWQLLTGTITIAEGSSSLSIRVTQVPSSSNKSFLVDDVVIELLPATLVSGSTEAGAEALEELAFGARVSPNPSRGEAVLHLATTRPGALRVRLFDVGGREVRRLLDESSASPGRRALAVGGRHARIAPGLYFWRVEAGEGTLTGRIAILD